MWRAATRAQARETRFVELASKGHDALLEIEVSDRVVEGVKKNPLLHRGELVHVLQVRRCHCRQLVRALRLSRSTWFGSGGCLELFFHIFASARSPPSGRGLHRNGRNALQGRAFFRDRRTSLLTGVAAIAGFQSGDELFQIFLTQPRLWEVRRRVGASLGRAAVRDQRAQRLLESLRQSLDRGAAVQVLAVDPGEAQAAPPDPSFDGERVAAAVPGAALGTDRREDAPERIVRQEPIELAQVVEADVRLRQGLHPIRGAPLRGEIAKDPVADPPLRNRPQLFLDREEGLRRPGCVRKLE